MYWQFLELVTALKIDIFAKEVHRSAELLTTVHIICIYNTRAELKVKKTDQASLKNEYC